jgi:hypothetical protein
MAEDAGQDGTAQRKLTYFLPLLDFDGPATSCVANTRIAIKNSQRNARGILCTGWEIERAN